MAGPPGAATFRAGADVYDRHIGRYGSSLAAGLIAAAGVGPGVRALDVGCGPGALTGELVARLGADAVTAVDPAEGFVEALRARHPDVTAQRAAAERLPFPDDAFDVALAQLVVHFMADPVAGLREMARVTRPGGGVAACVWDHGGGQGPVTPFWRAVRERDPDADDESDLAGARDGHLAALFAEAGLRDVEDTALAVERRYESFEDWWEPYTLGVGPAGAYVARLPAHDREALRERCRWQLPGDGPFTLTARAWAARGRP